MRIDGRLIAKEIENTIKPHVNNHCLAIMLVGNRPDSELYVSLKIKKCNELNIQCKIQRLPSNTQPITIINQINQWNQDITVNGILIQLPLPDHIHEDEILQHIDPQKDVDALTKNSPFKPCTPLAVMSVIEHYNMPLTHVCLVGCGNVGKGLIPLLIAKGATLTLTHRLTQNTKQYTQQADTIITACGSPLLVKTDWVKPNTYIIDVGINRIIDLSHPRGYRTVGDVDYDNVSKIAHVNKLTIGPVTIMMLIKNLVIGSKSNQ